MGSRYKMTTYPELAGKATEIRVESAVPPETQRMAVGPGNRRASSQTVLLSSRGAPYLRTHRRPQARSRRIEPWCRGIPPLAGFLRENDRSPSGPWSNRIGP